MNIQFIPSPNHPISSKSNENSCAPDPCFRPSSKTTFIIRSNEFLNSVKYVLLEFDNT